MYYYCIFRIIRIYYFLQRRRSSILSSICFLIPSRRLIWRIFHSHGIHFYVLWSIKNVDISKIRTRIGGTNCISILWGVVCCNKVVYIQCMIIEYKQQSILETQILEFPDISDNSSFPTRAGQGVKLSRVFVFLCSLTCIPNQKKN